MRRDPDKPVLFVDRSLGRAVVTALRAAGARVESHDDHFAQNAPDELWLERAGREGWIVITKDQRIRHRPNEIAAFRHHKVVGVFLTNANATGAENTDVLRNALAEIEALASTAHRPSLYRLGRAGILRKWS